MITVKADPARNVLIIAVEEPWTVEEAMGVPARIQQEVAKLRPGFALGFDVANVGVLDQGKTHLVSAPMHLWEGLGCGKIGTLYKSAVQELQLVRLAKEAGLTIERKRFTDRAEWEAYLSQPAAHAA